MKIIKKLLFPFFAIALVISCTKDDSSDIETNSVDERLLVYNQESGGGYLQELNLETGEVISEIYIGEVSFKGNSYFKKTNEIFAGENNKTVRIDVDSGISEIFLDGFGLNVISNISNKFYEFGQPIGDMAIYDVHEWDLLTGVHTFISELYFYDGSTDVVILESTNELIYPTPNSGLYKFNLNTYETTQINSTNYKNICVSQELAKAYSSYYNGIENKLVEINLETGVETFISNELNPFIKSVFVESTKEIVYTDYSGDLFKVNVETGEASQLSSDHFHALFIID
ncbi:hypothetical protein [Mangrovimonas aestuarii]|uniref:hypothetical protein n=1 Tax=Mangrovimonas aestuarii TaxID=3018443 RepID=UPI0023791E90|nr:hypothetical protein [Mangrovimonas aestuarii]